MSNLLKSKFLLGTMIVAVMFVAFSANKASASSAAANCQFVSLLKQGNSSAAVNCLQTRLNNAGFTIATSGAGSPGNESSYFGSLTTKAVKAFQNANPSTGSADGIVGSKTRAALFGASTGGTFPAGCTSSAGFSSTTGLSCAGGTTNLPAGCTSTAGFSPISGVSCATGVSTVPTTGLITASLAIDNPAAGTLVAGSAAADLAKFTFSNGTGAEVKVTSVKLQRTGYSADADLSNVYLYNGVNRLTDSASVSTSVITFNDTVGIFAIPANSSVTITVKADVASTLAGTVGVTLTSYTVGGVATAVSIAGNQHAGVTVTGMATLDFNTTTTPSASTVDPQNDYTMWNNVVTVGNRDIWLKTFRLRQIGSVNTSDLQNFRLYVDGIQVGTAVASLDASGYVTFDMSAAPVKMLTGSRTVKMIGDIVGGSSRTFSFSLRTASDAVATDSQIGVNVLATANNISFSARSATSATINSGTLTFTKRTDSPSGNVVLNSPGAVLARFDVKAYGEAMKIENLSFRIDEDDADTTYTLRNGAIYLDGAQIGSTTALAGDTDATQAYTNYTFGSSAVITPGVTRVLEVRADIYNSDGSNDVVNADTIQAEIVIGSSNVQRVASLTYGSYPAAAVEGNVLTASAGSLTVAKNTSYANNTTTVPKTAYLLGKYNIQASTTEGANITSIVVDWDTVVDFDASDDLNNVYLMIAGSTTGAGGIKSTVSDAGNTFSTNVNVLAGQTISVEVYGDVANTADDGATNTGISSITVSYTTTGGSSTSATAGEVTGQTITFGAGTFTSATDGSSPLNRIVSGNQEVTAAVFKFTAANETYTIKELQANVGSAAIGSVVSAVNFYDGATLLGSATLTQETNTAALLTGLNVSVPSNTNKLITVKLMLNTIGTGAGTSQSNASITLDSVKYADSQGVETTSDTDRTSNELYVYKAVPTVTHTDLSNTSSLVNGSAQDLYKFTVTAPAQGPVTLKQFYLSTTWSDGQTADTMYVESFKLFEDGVDVTSNVVIQDQAGTEAEGADNSFGEADSRLTVSWSAGLESVIAAGTTKTYTVRGVPQGFRLTGADTVGDSVSFVLNADTSHNGTSVFLNGVSGIATIWGLHTSAAATGSGTLNQFIWSDNSSNVHVPSENASSTGDWANGYKVLNLDLNGETWNK